MFLAPMLLEKRESPFDDDRYIFEPKIDGRRLILSIENGAVRLYTRHHNDVTRQYPELHNVPIADTSDTVLDGEVAVVYPETGAVEFESVMERFHLRKSEKIAAASVTNPVHFFGFDILRYKGVDLRKKPLTERKEILAAVVDNSPHFSRVLTVDGAGLALFDTIKKRGLEGIVGKRKGSAYVGRRDANWLKFINYAYADVEIVGYRKGEFGWLVQHNGKPAGIVELAVPVAHRKAFYNVSRGIITGEDRGFVYLRPALRAQVRFRNWTRAGILRTPEFVHFIL